MPDPRVVAVVQARMASTRLPGKVLADLGGKPILAWVVDRAARAKRINQVVVATTISPDDDAVVDFCRARGYAFFRGSMHDVLDRYYQASREFNAAVVVRLTADCPLIDPSMLDETIDTFLGVDPPLDFAANRLPGDRTVPIGLDIEVCTAAALAIAWREAQQPHQREHVMPFFYEQPERFRVRHIRHDPDLGDLRWTVDTPEDLELLRQVVAHFDDDRFSWQDVLALFQEQPELAEINAGVQHKSQYDVDERR